MLNHSRDKNHDRARVMCVANLGRSCVCMLVAAALCTLAGCVKREIKEDPWTSPRGNVEKRTYEGPTSMHQLHIRQPNHA